MKNKIGIYAGSFDPIHDGHLAFAQAAIDAGIDKVMFLTEPRPRRKQGVRALEHRNAMIDLAIFNKPSFGRIQLEQARFTPRETVPVLQELFKGSQLYMLLGDDVLHSLVTYIAGWPDIDFLASGMTFAIATRHHNNAKIQASMQELQTITNTKFHYEIIDKMLPSISSKQLRLELRRGNKPNGLDEKVLSYIQLNKLYSPSADSK